MKKEQGILNRILGTGNDSKMIIIRIIVGLIFISEGLLKYKQAQWLGPGRFSEIGFSHPFFWAYLTGAIEIFFGILVFLGFLTRISSIPLLIIMVTAFISTKMPLIADRGIWTFMHEYTTDFALSLLLILILIHGGGKWSFDTRLFAAGKP